MARPPTSESDCAYQNHTDAVRHYTPKARNPTRSRYRDKTFVIWGKRARNCIRSQIRSRVDLTLSLTKSLFHCLC